MTGPRPGSALPRCVFALSSGRSGTRFLASLFQENAAGAVCVHEPYVRGGRPTLFGPAIHARMRGDDAAIRALLDRKLARIARLGRPLYVETSHAFLKSFSHLAPAYFPNAAYVRLIRDPIATALSETNRELALTRLRVPFRNYRAPDGNRYFRWSLTGHEPIFDHFKGRSLSLLERYMVQWIEIENRATAFVAGLGPETPVAVLFSPGDLNDPQKLRAMFDHLGVATKSGRISLKGRRNRTPFFPTRPDTGIEDQWASVLRALPPETLEIFAQAPYTNAAWKGRFDCV